MKKILILLLSLSISASAFSSTKELRFESGISFYGKVGFVDLILQEDFDKKTYKIRAVAKSTGIIQALSGNRQDIFTSEGTIDDGVYTPFVFTKQTLRNGLDELTTYSFDYVNNSVLKTKIKKELVTQSSFDMNTFRYKEIEKLVEKTTIKTIDLHNNDFLTLYLNLEHGNLQNGDISYIDNSKKDNLALINKGVFEVEKNNGDDSYKIVILDDKDSIFFKEVVSVNVSFYGDAYIKKVSEKTTIKENSK